MPEESKSGSLLDGLAVGLALLLGIALCFPAILQARADSRRTTCADRLQHIGQACNSFAAVQSSYLPSNRSKPHIGWNALILPYLNQAELGNRYDFSRDWWDGTPAPNQQTQDEQDTNRQLGRTQLEVFVCPDAPHPQRLIYLKDPDGVTFAMAPTDYVGSAGAYLNDNVPERLYRGALASPGRHYGASGVTAAPAVRLAEITDGLSQTLLIVEMADKPNHWRANAAVHNAEQETQGKELVPSFSFGQWAAPNWAHLRSYDSQGQNQLGCCAVNCSNQGSIYGFHQGGAHVCFVDGSVRLLRAKLEQEIMVALVSIADGEVLADSDY